MSAERTKMTFAAEIREAYPWLDEQHVDYWANKCIENLQKHE